jgi:hypothetical protein
LLGKGRGSLFLKAPPGLYGRERFHAGLCYVEQVCIGDVLLVIGHADKAGVGNLELLGIADGFPGGVNIAHA